MKLVLMCLTLILSSMSFAKEKMQHHEAHVHGTGTLGIAFDDLVGKLEFKIPSESIFGFEYVPKTEKDKKAMQDGLDKLEKNISEMVVLDSSSKCVVAKEKIEVVKEEHEPKSGKHKNEHHGEHSETIAIFDVKCEKSLLGTKITFNFQKFFPKIKDLDVQVLIGSVQKSVEAKKNGVFVELK